MEEYKLIEQTLLGENENFLSDILKEGPEIKRECVGSLYTFVCKLVAKFYTQVGFECSIKYLAFHHGNLLSLDLG